MKVVILFVKRILDLRKNGVLEELQNKWWKSCEENSISDSVSLDIIGGAFIFLGVAVCFSLALQATETILKLRKKRAEERQQEQMKYISKRHQIIFKISN